MRCFAVDALYLERVVGTGFIVGTNLLYVRLSHCIYIYPYILCVNHICFRCYPVGTLASRVSDSDSEVPIRSLLGVGA